MVASVLDRLIERASLIEGKIAKLEDEASLLKDDLRLIYEEELPCVLHENGLLAAPLEDGRTVVIEQVVNVKQGDKRSLAAWLAARNYDSVIKTTLEFPKGSDTTAAEDVLHAQGVDYTKDLTVHPMTLKKVMREHIEAGGDYPPEEAATVTIYERAKVKGGKE